MNKNTFEKASTQPEIQVKSALEDVLRSGAQQMLMNAVEIEVAEYVERHAHLRDEDDHALVVRNGHLPDRKLVTGIGPVVVRHWCHAGRA